ncbi:alkylglycerol monooxygenase-like isoform X2 [Ornithodoros turicata]|uniref:alkylglycerol monooxygenase-like isoform X2 n=1 Tax=Ornithodoros turicata TaxID=34597 RepID=UPI003138A638
MSRIFFESAQIVSYLYIYENFRIYALPWNSNWTWLFAFLAIDFGYYWAHRFSHEVNILWAAHQVHHSSEFYNLTTALRQSVAQDYFVPVFYLPLAFIMPPSVYVVHRQFNLLFQFWIHTEVIHKMGPLEYIINTPSHHRVHHGRNRYCIDKNYAGTLIIWDRIFGTFEAECAEVVYGLTTPINTVSPWAIQMCHFQYMWSQLREAEGLGDKLSIIFKGPGWSPGKPRLGDPHDIPYVAAPIRRYASPANILWKAYVTFHFILLLGGYFFILYMKSHFSSWAMVFVSAYLIFALQTFSALLECTPLAYHMDSWRCLLFFFADYFVLPARDHALWSPVRIIFCASLLGILAIIYKETSFKPHYSQTEKSR